MRLFLKCPSIVSATRRRHRTTDGYAAIYRSQVRTAAMLHRQGQWQEPLLDYDSLDYFYSGNISVGTPAKVRTSSFSVYPSWRAHRLLSFYWTRAVRTCGLPIRPAPTVVSCIVPSQLISHPVKPAFAHWDGMTPYNVTQSNTSSSPIAQSWTLTYALGYATGTMLARDVVCIGFLCSAAQGWLIVGIVRWSNTVSAVIIQPQLEATIFIVFIPSV